MSDGRRSSQKSWKGVFTATVEGTGGFGAAVVVLLAAAEASVAAATFSRAIACAGPRSKRVVTRGWRMGGRSHAHPWTFAATHDIGLSRRVRCFAALLLVPRTRPARPASALGTWRRAWRRSHRSAASGAALRKGGEGNMGRRRGKRRVGTSGRDARSERGWKDARSETLRRALCRARRPAKTTFKGTHADVVLLSSPIFLALSALHCLLPPPPLSLSFRLLDFFPRPLPAPPSTSHVLLGRKALPRSTFSVRPPHRLRPSVRTFDVFSPRLAEKEERVPASDSLCPSLWCGRSRGGG